MEEKILEFMAELDLKGRIAPETVEEVLRETSETSGAKALAVDKFLERIREAN